MPWVIALLVVPLIATLAGLFVFSAHVIRRDFRDRFDRLRQRLENDANALVDHLLNENRPT